MKRPAVVHYGSGRASQDMCRQPEVSPETEIRYLIESVTVREIRETIEDAGGVDRLSAGNIMHLNRLCENWRAYIPD
jgi:hypothetical protein